MEGTSIMATTAKPATTTLDSDNTKPSVTAPGDGPADTTDPNERASSVTPNPGPEAIAAGTVNAVQLVPAAKPAARTKKDRVEEYTILANGKPVTIVRNVETGESKIKS